MIKRVIQRVSFIVLLCFIALISSIHFQKKEITTNTEQAKVEETFSYGLKEDEHKREDLHIVAIGDSLTQGVGDESKNGGYVGALEQTLKEHEAVQNISIKSFGKRGNRTDQLLKRLEEQLDIQSAISKADVIIVTIGANDIMKVAKNNFTNLQYEAFANEQDEYEKRLRSIFSQLNAFNPNAMVYLIGLYNPFQEYFSDIPELDQIMNDWNNVGQRVTNEFPNAQFIPIRDIFENANQPLYAEDHFHPNKIAYQLIATRVLHYLQQDLIPLEERG